eukprot:6202902-Pleurochrysis_carterae.AAC.3
MRRADSMDRAPLSSLVVVVVVQYYYDRRSVNRRRAKNGNPVRMITSQRGGAGHKVAKKAASCVELTQTMNAPILIVDARSAKLA